MGTQAPAMWGWGLIFLAEQYKETKLSLEKYALALESLVGFFCLFLCLFYFSVYCVTFFRNARNATSMDNECGVFLC